MSWVIFLLVSRIRYYPSTIRHWSRSTLNRTTHWGWWLAPHPQAEGMPQDEAGRERELDKKRKISLPLLRPLIFKFRRKLISKMKSENQRISEIRNLFHFKSLYKFVKYQCFTPAKTQGCTKTQFSKVRYWGKGERRPKEFQNRERTAIVEKRLGKNWILFYLHSVVKWRRSWKNSFSLHKTCVKL